MREVLFPQITHPDFVNTAAVSHHRIRGPGAEAALDGYGVIIEIPDKITISGQELCFNFFRNIGVTGCEHCLGTDYQYREAIRLLQILSQQEQTGLDTVFQFIRVKQMAEGIRRNQKIPVLFLAVHPVQLMENLPQLVLPQFAHAMQPLELGHIHGQEFFNGRTTEILVPGHTADLLDIICQVSSGSIVIYPHNIRYIHAHAEGLGTDHHKGFTGLECSLCGILFFLTESCMIAADFIAGRRRHFLIDVVHCGAEGTVDQSLFSLGHGFRNFLCYMVHLEFVVATLCRFIQRMDIKVDVVTANPTQILDGIVQAQSINGILHHIFPAAIDSSGSQAEYREVAAVLPLPLQIISQEPIVGTEITAPAGYSMSLIHYEQSQLPFTQQSFQRGGQEHLRSYVKNGLFASVDGVQALFPFLMGYIGVEEGSTVNSTGFQLADLILHQCNQRSNDNGNRLMYLSQINTGHLIEG